MPRIVRYGAHRSQFLEQWPASGQDGRAAVRRGSVVMIHGGWWRAQHDLHLTDPLCARLAGAGWTVGNLEFRRTGGDGGGWPQTLSDVAKAIEALDRQAGLPLVLVGHSAGGHLALLAARRAAADAVVALAPITDVARCAAAGLGEGATPLFMGDADEAAYVDASPIGHLPLGIPQLVMHGTADVRVPVEHSRDYVTQARSLGDPINYVEVDGGDHFCVVDPEHPSWTQVMEWIGLLGPSPPSALAPETH
jgi:dipeptidyl aminopeptidase/acylaminoacyl peptidase